MKVWTMTADFAMNDAEDTYVRVFASHVLAREAMMKEVVDFFLHDALAKADNVQFEYDDPDAFVAYEDGNWTGNHVSWQIDEQEVVEEMR